MPTKRTRAAARDRAPVVGITGAMGAGKSLVARVFEECGAALIDADSVGHELLKQDSAIQQALAKRFGADILAPDGAVNRTMLGSRVFAEPQGAADLNRIMHPDMIACIKRRVTGLLRRRRYPMVVVDAALLFEAQVDACFDYILVVSAPEERRIDWIRRRTGLDETSIRLRLSQQIPQELKEKGAHFILENDSTPEVLKDAAARAYERILRHFHEGIPWS